MVLKKEKEKILGEVFDEERIRTFLEFGPPQEGEQSYHLLEKAYRGMIAENFATFVQLFVEAGHDINIKNNHGNTFLQTIKKHKQSEAYISALEKAGAV